MKKFIIAFPMIIQFLVPQIVSACSVCFGMPSDQSITQGLDMAIIMLIGVTGTVLGGIAAFFIYMIRRGKQIKKIMGIYDSTNGNKGSINA